MMIETAQESRFDGVLFEGNWLPLVGLLVVEAKAFLRDAGNISYFADAFVDGRQVAVAHVLRPGDRLEFIQQFGFKASDDLAAEKAMAVALLKADPELARIVDEVYELRLNVDHRLAVMALRVIQWAEKRFGPIAADAAARLNMMASDFSRLADRGQTRAESRPGRRPISERVRVDVAGGEVVIDGVHHALDEKCLAILHCLVTADGCLVSRNEMKSMSKALMGEQHIERHITRIKETNDAVGRIIETDDRHRGYRIRRDF
jgi:hypothetical protein